MICRPGHAATLCGIRKRKCAAPNAGSRPLSRGCASFATKRASSIRARPPTPPRRWPAGYGTRSSEPTPNCPPSNITCAPSVRMLEARLQSLQTELRSVESEVTDTEKSRSEVLSRVMGSYERLESEHSFAEKAYQHALEALDRS